MRSKTCNLPPLHSLLYLTHVHWGWFCVRAKTHPLCLYWITDAIPISVADLISWMSTYPDTSMVFVILKCLSRQHEGKKKYHPSQIIWMPFVMGNYHTIHICIVISHDWSDCLPETYQVSDCFQHSFWTLTPRNPEQREKAFIMLRTSQIVSVPSNLL